MCTTQAMRREVGSLLEQSILSSRANGLLIPENEVGKYTIPYELWHSELKRSRSWHQIPLRKAEIHH